MKHLLTIMLTLSFLSGCAHPKVIDEVNMSQAIGYDLIKDNMIEGIFIVPIFQQEKMGKYQILTGKSSATSDIQAVVSKKADKPVVLGQTRIILFSEEVVHKIGIRELTDFLYREPQLGNRVYLTVVEGKVKDVLETKPPNKNVNIGIFLSDLIHQQIVNWNGPDTNLHLFLGNSLESGGDAYLPLFKKKKKNVVVSGVALFHENKLVSKVRSRDMFIFKTLVQSHKRGIYKYKLKNKGQSKVVVESIRSRSNYDVSGSKENPSIHVKVIIKGEIKESLVNKKLTGRKMIRKMERELENDLTKQATRLMKEFQDKEIDPLSLKKKYHAKYKNTAYSDWKKVYPNMDISVETEVHILQTGISE